VKTEKQYNELKQAAIHLIDRIEVMINSDEYKNVWTIAWAHGMPYKGINVKKEYDILKELVKKN
jgi:hypothetical protein